MQLDRETAEILSIKFIANKETDFVIHLINKQL